MTDPVGSPPVGADRSADTDEVVRRFEEHLSFADRLARRYSQSGRPDDDLQQVAHIGLLLACRRFDPEQGRFMRFASMTIVGELKKHLRNTGWSVHVPRSLQEDSITVETATIELTQRLGRNPLVSEIAERTALSVERVTEGIRVRHARFRTDLDHASSTVPADGSTSEAAIVQTALAALRPEQRELIALRYDDGLTQREIGRRLGVSQPEAHRRIAAALEQLRQQLDTIEDGRTPP